MGGKLVNDKRIIEAKKEIEIMPFYLRGTGCVLRYGNWHS